MKIKSVRIKSFRTITVEQEVVVGDELTLVGPNNSGKTNTLLAIMAFFTGYDNEYDYRVERDLPYGQRNVKTSITCTFSGDPEGEHSEIFDKLEKLKEMLGVATEDKREFSINVYFNGSKAVYQVYPGMKRPKDKQAQFSVAQKQFVSSVLDQFQWYYIPSNKSIEELYHEFVTPFVRRKVVTVLEKYDYEIRDSISNLTDSMNDMLSANGIHDVETSMEYPGKVMEDFISGLDLYVKDKNSSSIFEKGMGLQAAILLSSFKWITEQQSKKMVIWLLEEPETFMHPSLAEKCSRVIDQLAGISTVVKTTHAINFIPSNINKVQGVSLGKDLNTIINPYSSHIEATESIRCSLGVKFSDYFGLSKKNIFFEGETDRLYIEKVLGATEGVSPDPFPVLRAGEVQLREFTGVTDLKGFLKANYHLIRKETALVSLFDGDDAGVKAVKELEGFYGKKGGYNAQKDYVLIPGRMAIESIFPQEWVFQAYETEKSWFESWVPDAGGDIVFFSIRDKSKKAYMEFIFKKIDEADVEEWIGKVKLVVTALEEALLMQERSMVA
ncbi:ATP-dependent nuclease [Billgrantia gudaonensis]|uniref:Predicted ATP-dependent endonuclease of the OLD family, contains P-loop ATPase and TOPRIM domains n=1 Tax=Billgrantia gudaonensis TaxID=376427 RepID=A0A1G8YTR8_9GAMM|nr:AAA family ATPase [Halomonas gudaonensis]SDK06173.1 Predicted ATP-dependent endonuclease of the OLD family, contains P-loop ATPase and TOPRIM domains [Halomonas gudaonensis]